MSNGLLTDRPRGAPPAAGGILVRPTQNESMHRKWLQIPGGFVGASKWMSPASASDPSRSPVHRSCQGAGRPGVAGVRAGDGKEPIGGCMRQATGGGGAAMAAKSGVVWAPGRSFWAADVRDVARGACRAGGLRLGPVGAARPRPASDLPPRADHRPPTRHFQPPPPRALLLFFSSQVLGCVWQLLGAGPSARG